MTRRLGELVAGATLDRFDRVQLEDVARFGGHRWVVPTEAILPASTMFPVYDRRYTRTAAGPGSPAFPAGGAGSRPAGPGAEVLDTHSGYDRWAAIYDGEDNPLVTLEEPEVDRLLGEAGEAERGDEVQLDRLAQQSVGGGLGPPVVIGALVGCTVDREGVERDLHDPGRRAGLRSLA